MTVEVILDWPELMDAAIVGARRQISAMHKGLKNKHGYNGESEFELHIQGACAERATAKALNRYWSSSVNTFRIGGDVGSLQVRYRPKTDYDLLVRKNDRDEDLFILVTGRAPVFAIVGWIKGCDAKNDAYLRRYAGREEAYFVPQDKLKPLADLT